MQSLSSIKSQLIKMLSMIDENIELLRNDLIQLINQSNNQESLQKLLDYAQREGTEKIINQKIINFLKRENPRLRFINPDTQKLNKKGSPSSKNTRLGFDMKESFLDLTKEHFRNNFTYKIIKLLVQLVAKSQVSNELKDSFIDLLEDPNNLIPISAFDKPSTKGNVDDYLSPKITNHPLYQEIKSELLNSVGEKATGTGEYYLTIFGKNGGLIGENQKSSFGDVFIENTPIEVKNGDSASAINAEIGENRHQMDNYNKRWLLSIGFTKKEILDIFASKVKSKNTSVPVDFGNKELKIKLNQLPDGKSKVKEYLAGLYTTEGNDGRGLSPEDLDELTNQVYTNIGNISNNKLAELIAPYVFKLYKNNKDFNIYLLIDKNGNFISTNSDVLPDEIKIKNWVIGQGGNNYPYRAYITVSM